MSVSDEPHLAAGASSAEHLDQIGRKAGRGLTWSLVGTFVTKSGSFALGLGSTRYTVWLNAGWAVALVPALWIGAHLDGIRGAAIAHGVVAVFVALPLAVVALRLAGVSLVPTLPALVRPTIGAAIAAAVILLIDPVVNGNSFVQLSLAGGAGLIVYILVVVPLDKLRRVTALRAHFR